MNTALRNQSLTGSLRIKSSSTPSKWLFCFSLLVVFATLILILAGGLVTSHDAGLAVPDWPTSYGQWFPPMVGNVFWEHGHRMIAGIVGILTLILVLWIQFREKRKGVKVLAWVALGMVLAQALLGGLTVIFMLPAPVSIAHACLAQTFFCALVALTYFLGPFPEMKNTVFTSESGVSRLRRLLILTAIFIYLQLILGATVRHTSFTWPLVIHIMVAFLILIHVLLVVLRTAHLRDDFALKKEKGWEGFEGLFAILRRSAMGVGFAALCQIFLGLGAFIFTRMLAATYAPSHAEVLFTAAHQTTGAIILALTFLMTLMVWR